MTQLKTGTDLVRNARRVVGAADDARPAAAQTGPDAPVAVLASLNGEIDLHNSPDVRVALLQLIQQERPRKLILDLSGVPYMDSSALAVLVECLRHMRAIGGKVYLTRPQPRVRGLLEIARLETVFVLADDEDEALRA